MVDAGGAGTLPQAPGEGTFDGAVVAAAIVLRNDGIVVSGNVESIRHEKGEFDLDYPVTTLRVERTFAGTSPDVVVIRTADPAFKMDEGGRYLAFLSKDDPKAANYTPGRDQPVIATAAA